MYQSGAHRPVSARHEQFANGLLSGTHLYASE
jgi:hypothetical protein